jgi:ABC-type Zn uptake system ZnuABC Zn-binding protein ZnuA
MKDSYGTCLDEISKLTSEFNNRVERYQGRSFVTTEKVFPN